MEEAKKQGMESDLTWTKDFFSLFQEEQFHTDDIKVFSPSQRIRDVGDLLWGSVAKLQAATMSL